MKTFKITIEVTEEELRKLGAYVDRTAILKMAGCHVETIVDTLGDRVIKAFVVRYKKVATGAKSDQ